MPVAARTEPYDERATASPPSGCIQAGLHDSHHHRAGRNRLWGLLRPPLRSTSGHPGGHGWGVRVARSGVLGRGTTHSQGSQRLIMFIRRRTFLSLTATLLAVRPAAIWNHAAMQQYTPSDPASVGRTGRPQLLEFYHHLAQRCLRAPPIRWRRRWDYVFDSPIEVLYAPSDILIPQKI
jgi:hypothetical protein